MQHASWLFIAVISGITIYRTVYLHTDMCLQTLTHIQLKNKLSTTVAFLRCCNLI